MHGPGEYFGWNSNVSHGYCKGGSMMIVTAVLQGHWVKPVQPFCYVVSNPMSWDISYCVPLAVINFGMKKTVPFMHYLPNSGIRYPTSGDEPLTSADQVLLRTMMA